VSQGKNTGDCPLCNGPASYEHISRNDRKLFDCQSCKEPYLIARKAENVLRAEFSKTVRPKFAAEVQKTPAGKIAEIYCPAMLPGDPSEAVVSLDYISYDQDAL